MKSYLKKNIIGLGSLFVAIAALIVAVQANQINRENQKPEIEIDTVKVSVGWNPTLTGCKSIKDGVTSYALNRKYYYHLFVTNQGGRTTSLVWIEVTDAISDVRGMAITLYEPKGKPKPDAPYEKLPVDIDPGTTREWLVEGYLGTAYYSKEQALQSADWPGFPEMQKPIIWKFTFSDGTVIQREMSGDDAIIDREPDFGTAIEKECEEMTLDQELKITK